MNKKIVTYVSLLVFLLLTQSNKCFDGNKSEKNKFPDNVKEMLKAELNEKDWYNDNVLCGFWFTPGEARYINIFYHKNKTFQMMDYVNGTNNSTHSVYREGTYRVKNDSVILKCNKTGEVIKLRHWTQNAKSNSKTSSRSMTKYLTKGSKKTGWKYYMVKGTI